MLWQEEIIIVVAADVVADENLDRGELNVLVVVIMCALATV